MDTAAAAVYSAGMTSSSILAAAMADAGFDGSGALQAAIIRVLPAEQRVSERTVQGWLAGDGIRDAYLPALAAALPSLDLGELARALGRQAADRAGLTPTARAE